MPTLEYLDPPRERVNSYTNNFTMHIVGSLLESGTSYHFNRLNISLTAGIVPVFFLHSSQKMSIVPLLDPHHAEFDQNTWGSPYLFVKLDSIIYRYINITLLYDTARLNFRTIDFDDNLNWINPERSALTQSFKIETSLLLPMGGDMAIQAGYGYTFDSTQFDGGMPNRSNRQYLILTARKTGN